MATQTINESTIDLPGDDDGDDGDDDCFIFTTSLSSRGFTKHDAISVESYHRDRHLTLKSKSPIFINLDDDDDDEDDLKIIFFEGQSSKKNSLFDCEICVETKQVNESFKIKGCNHIYCRSCVSKYIAAKLQDNVLSVRCPVSACSGQLEPEQCRFILPKEVFDRWGDALCEALVMRSRRFYCPYKDCSALVFIDESRDQKKMKESECPHCNRMVCVSCETKWHGEITCEEFMKLAENERERDDILLKKMAESHKWRRCPSCKFYIEKSQGCLYMKCRCGLGFCYNCGTPSKDNSHYCYNCKH